MERSVAGTDVVEEGRSLLDEFVLEGARRMLRAAMEAEVDAFVEEHASFRDENGCRQVVRNGHLPERTVLTGAGELPVKQPRVRDRRGSQEPDAVRFESKILPPYMRRSKSIDELIPWLYLRGVSTGDMQPALEALVGDEAQGLSASVVTRLTAKWRDEHQEWCKRDLSGKEYVYIWADGIHFNIRLEEDRQCILVLLGATKDGEKEVIAIQDGYRESKQDWRELFLDLKSRGLTVPPKIAVGDGALGFWSALEEVFPTTIQQRCWVHKTANILNKMPKKVQQRAKNDLHQIWMAETREAAHKAFDLFLTKYEAKYPKAAECLSRDRDELLAFYDFPAEHWIHLRTTNPIESTFASVRHRHKRTKGSGSRAACLAMVYKLLLSAQARWRKLNSYQLIIHVVEGRKFNDGILENAA